VLCWPSDGITTFEALIPECSEVSAQSRAYFSVFLAITISALVVRSASKTLATHGWVWLAYALLCLWTQLSTPARGADFSEPGGLPLQSVIAAQRALYGFLYSEDNESGLQMLLMACLATLQSCAFMVRRGASSHATFEGSDCAPSSPSVS
jgi:hypothetical protein